MTTTLARTAIAAPMALRCPKCGTVMTAHERSGVVVDQCRDCRGFFLDHGELERLVAAEGGAWLGPAPRPATAWPFDPSGPPSSPKRRATTVRPPRWIPGQQPAESLNADRT